MSVPVKYGIPFTPEEEQAIETALQTIISTLQRKVEFNMTEDERKSLSKVGNERAPYVLKSIGDYAVQFPNLNGLAYPYELAAIDMKNMGLTTTMLTSLKYITEMTEELQMVVGHFCFKFMRDQYQNAERYRGDNVPGAQVVYEGLKDCFEGQGGQPNPTPPTP